MTNLHNSNSKTLLPISCTPVSCCVIILCYLSFQSHLIPFLLCTLLLSATGGDSALNANILRDVFGGARGPVADALNLNAGYALAAAKVTATPQDGVLLAQEVQRAGKAAATLEKWIAVSNEALKQEQQAAEQQLATAGV